VHIAILPKTPETALGVAQAIVAPARRAPEDPRELSDGCFVPNSERHR